VPVHIDPGSDADYFQVCSFLEHLEPTLVEPSSKRPAVSSKEEDHIEDLSAAAGAGGAEAYLDHWARGTYHCARCEQPLYCWTSKWNGPCRWPSFRRPVEEGDHCVLARAVEGYASYTCGVAELYCGNCRLFLGHKFEDARQKGDKSWISSGWRH